MLLNSRKGRTLICLIEGTKKRLKVACSRGLIVPFQYIVFFFQWELIFGAKIEKKG